MASDTFTDSNKALSAHDANWTAGVNLANLEVYSNAVRSTKTWDQAAAYYSGAALDMSQADQLGGTGSDDYWGGPSVRVPTNNSGYAGVLSAISGANFTYIYLRKNDAWQAQTAGTWATASLHTIKITASGTSPTTTLTVYVDTVSKISYGDSSTPLTTARDGLMISNGVGAATPAMLDNWLNQEGAAFDPSAVPWLAELNQPFPQKLVSVPY